MVDGSWSFVKEHKKIEKLEGLLKQKKERIHRLKVVLLNDSKRDGKTIIVRLPMTEKEKIADGTNLRRLSPKKIKGVIAEIREDSFTLIPLENITKPISIALENIREIDVPA
jgi:hypothetical protein